MSTAATDPRRKDLVGLVKALEPPDETTLQTSVFLAQRWGLAPSHYTFHFETNLPFSSELTDDYRHLVGAGRLWEPPGSNPIQVHPDCPPDAVAEADSRLGGLKDVAPPVRLALALLYHLDDSSRRHPDLRAALTRWCLVPPDLAEQSFRLFLERQPA